MEVTAADKHFHCLWKARPSFWLWGFRLMKLRSSDLYVPSLDTEFRPSFRRYALYEWHQLHP
jgi:hypothetical protein